MIVPLIIFLLVVGVILWLLGPRIHPTIRALIIALLVIAVALWLLDALGLFPMPEALRIRGTR